VKKIPFNFFSLFFRVKKPFQKTKLTAFFNPETDPNPDRKLTLEQKTDPDPDRLPKVNPAGP
jgi:hypothetical protein